MNKFQVFSRTGYDEETGEAIVSLETTRTERRVAEQDVALIGGICGRKAWYTEAGAGQ